jgi:hypothetical protein
VPAPGTPTPPPPPLPPNPQANVNPPRPRTSNDAMQEAVLLSTAESQQQPTEDLNGSAMPSEMLGSDAKIGSVQRLGRRFAKRAGLPGGPVSGNAFSSGMQAPALPTRVSPNMMSGSFSQAQTPAGPAMGQAPQLGPPGALSAGAAKGPAAPGVTPAAPSPSGSTALTGRSKLGEQFTKRATSLVTTMPSSDTGNSAIPWLTALLGAATMGRAGRRMGHWFGGRFQSMLGQKLPSHHRLGWRVGTQGLWGATGAVSGHELGQSIVDQMRAKEGAAQFAKQANPLPGQLKRPAPATPPPVTPAALEQRQMANLIHSLPPQGAPSLPPVPGAGLGGMLRPAAPIGPGLGALTVQKRGEQDNSGPQRSATGESKNLRFNDAGPQLYGQQAWDLSKWSRSDSGGKKKDVTPFAFGRHGGQKSAMIDSFVARLKLAGLTRAEDIDRAIAGLDEQLLGKEAKDELAEQWREKRANGFWRGAGNFFGNMFSGRSPVRAGARAAVRPATPPVTMTGAGSTLRGPVPSMGGTNPWRAPLSNVSEPIQHTLGGWVAPGHLAMATGLGGLQTAMGVDPGDAAQSSLQMYAAMHPMLRQFAQRSPAAALAYRPFQHRTMLGWAGDTLDQPLSTALGRETGLGNLGRTVGTLTGAGHGGLTAANRLGLTPGISRTFTGNPMTLTRGARSLERGLNNVVNGADNLMMGSFAPLQWLGSRAAALPYRMAGHTPPAWTQAAAHSLPPGLQRGLFNAGRAVGIGGLGLTAGTMGLNAIGNQLAKPMTEQAAQFMGEAVPHLEDRMDQYLRSRGITGNDGRVHNPLDNILGALGLDPQRLHPLQKALILGGGAFGLGGLATGGSALPGAAAAAGGLLGLGGGPGADGYAGAPLAGLFGGRARQAAQQQQRIPWPHEQAPAAPNEFERQQAQQQQLMQQLLVQGS